MFFNSILAAPAPNDLIGEGVSAIFVKLYNDHECHATVSARYNNYNHT